MVYGYEMTKQFKRDTLNETCTLVYSFIMKKTIKTLL